MTRRTLRDEAERRTSSKTQGAFFSAFTACVQAALISPNLSVRALFPCVELFIPRSLFFTVSVSQHSWCSEAWIDVTGGSRKQQTDYCSLLLICQIKELSTVPLEKRITANKTAQVLRVNKSSDLTISDMSQADSARYQCQQSELS